MSRSRFVALLSCIAAAGVLLSACGSSSTSSSVSATAAASSGASTTSGASSTSGGTPSYCPAVNSFKSAVQQVGKLNIRETGVSGLTSTLTNLETTGKAAVAAVEDSFATETAALKSSLKSLGTTVGQLASSQTRATAIAQVPIQISAAKTSFDSFLKATKPNCG